MFQHILIPTDGSELSQNAAKRAIQLAKELNAKVTGFYAAPDYTPDLYEDSFPIHAMSKERFLEDAKNRTTRYLGFMEELAREAGVSFQSAWVMSDYPAEAICQAADNHGCDLICMASHGRKGVQALLLGSETQKVLAYCKIPVLVYR
jgi:nucleotide-binding universal stress UspA family protein